MDRNDIDVRLLDNWLHEECIKKKMFEALKELEQEWIEQNDEPSE
jgi:hypothetical protein